MPSTRPVSVAPPVPWTSPTAGARSYWVTPLASRIGSPSSSVITTISSLRPMIAPSISL